MRQGAVVLAAQHGQHPETVWAAAEEASRRGALLRVVHAAPDDRRSRALVADVREVLRTLRWRAEVEVDVVEADPVEVLLTESDDASLLVLGVDHGPGGPRPWRHHSVLDAVALAARCPTIAVPSRLLGAGHSAGIVVAIDEVATAHGLLDFAFDAARRRGLPLHVFHAAGVPSDYTHRYGQRLRLEDLVDDRRLDCPDVRVDAVVEAGWPVQACLAASFSATMLVVGRPEGGHPRLSARATALRLVRRSACPVALVPLNRQATTASVDGREREPLTSI